MTDEDLMRAAFAEARRALGHTGPNPIVGAVIYKGSEIIARGHHVRAGEPHAEIVALKQVPGDLSRCTLYSTLEPCAHHGRTGPCAEAIVAAKVGRVVYGCVDPNPLVGGRGIAIMKKAGIEVVGPVLEAEAQALIRDFALSVREKRPYVIAKAGMTLDARIATKKGEAKWITSEASRERAYVMRSQVQAIVVGVNTVIADSPSLTAHGKGVDPLRVVFDSKLRTPPKWKALRGTVIVCEKTASVQRQKALEQRGATVLRIGTNVKTVLRSLYRSRGIMRVLVEGGPRLMGSFADASLIDELALFVAPTLFGGAAPAFVLGDGVSKIKGARRFQFQRAEPIGGDLLLSYLAQPQRSNNPNR